MSCPKIAVIIPTHNRFDKMMLAVNSALQQDWYDSAEGEDAPVEVWVINDKSDDERYYQKNLFPGNRVHFIHLQQSSREKFGYPCPGYVRNQGLFHAMADIDVDYIAFLDDDDYWFPQKLSEQITTMMFSKTSMSCTDALTGTGAYDAQKKKRYQRYNGEFAKNYIFRRTRLDFFPIFWNRKYILSNNSIICSSVVIEKRILELAEKKDAGGKCKIFLEIPKDGSDTGVYEDYELWKECLKYTKCRYLEEPLLYYDRA